jgi:hypothetical protein
VKRVVIESPFAGRGLTAEERAESAARNLAYLRACMADCLHRGEAPFASHGLYTQPGVLRDDVPEERTLGIDAGFAWRRAADLTVFYVDLGWSGGMRLAMDHCEATGLPWVERRLKDGAE